MGLPAWEVPLDVEIRHLRMLVTIADAGSVTAASKRLGLSQPALTAQLQRIERNLGGSLFVRRTDGSVPTPLGQDVLNHARAVLCGMQSIRQRVAQHSGQPPAGMPVRIGGYCGFLHVHVARWISEAPWATGVRVWEELVPQSTVDMVARGDLDMALFYEWPGGEVTLPPGVRGEAIYPDEPVFVIMAHDHPLAKRKSVTLTDIADHPWADEPPGLTPWSVYRQQVCHRAGVLLDQQHHSVYVPTVHQLVLARLAVAPAIATARDLPGRMVVRSLDGNPMRQTLKLVYRTEGTVAAHIEELTHQIVLAYAARAHCSTAFGHWWSDQGRHLAPSF
ncbi:LysR family transcriptional regulator [Kibdelosporangium phytohabitans]|uniref:LysR family transcriptional regulator n=1 Tax=Kibdelosporangium phytohabitans TaxID=860235 RepID=UPI0019EA0EA9|nr:LysR family transcriptional regulator [Kibdelosporangium phytohabitans]MBE1469074.1 DNA-binding transcriptional LysR family regulator [Kibdelosporangium phytohabitans]